MSVDIVELRAFYASPLGSVARRRVVEAMDRLWGPLHGQRVLGLGFTIPFLRPEGADRTLALMPATQGVVAWPEGGRSSTCLADPLMLPLPDSCVDRILVVHALETSESPSELLYEAWRVLTPGGRLLVVAPNRRGLWARLDVTPFGQGQPYSRSQLKRLLRRALFTPETWTETLYMPPLRSGVLIRTAEAWERLGTGLNLPFAGLHVVDATKQLHRPLLVRQVRRAERFAPVLVPSHAPSRREAPPARA
ncbi:class I SAM-dependent methyltransferase [Salinarimonas soli]|uniref:Methyltransferase domain-containing protein n=1 Tax=Salinarimonas soli TaxID=1638099 RepID=A0A5B2VFD5_9HYPH|nr:methyltransferase domain-containing protein [Salinarimonas soli]KAA2237316.1 methyltransferase domain-containing protein [Salinarimonas soli]